MIWIVALVLILISGCFLAWGLAARVWQGNRLTGILGAFGLAVLFGPGAASIGYFVLLTAGFGSTRSVWPMLLGLLGISSAVYFLNRARISGQTFPLGPLGKFPLAWVLMATVCMSLVISIRDFQAATLANADGDWDASAIWNLRARFLASGPDLWRRAISSEIGSFMIGASHPGYPLFLSGTVGLLWNIAGSFLRDVPITVALLNSLAVLALLVASLARRSIALGLLAGSILLGTELYASQASFQYADMLQALAFLATLILLDAASEHADPRVLIACGVAIGLAPWIKNEGQPFAIAALGVALWRFRAKTLWVLCGALPGIAATAAIKLLSEGRESMFPATLAEALAKIADPSRWVQSFVGFAKAVGYAGPWWGHPLVLVLALILALGFVPAQERRQRIWLGIPIAVTLAAEFGLYLVTTADLAWHIATSATRLVLQVWPSLLWFVFSLLRTPEQYYPSANRKR